MLGATALSLDNGHHGMDKYLDTGNYPDTEVSIDLRLSVHQDGLSSMR